MAKGVTESDLFSWVEKFIKNEHYSDYEINVVGTSEKGDGYLGDIVFATVTGTTKLNGKKELNLVVKHGKSNDHLRKITPVRTAFEIEIHFYAKIIPAFRKLQAEHKVQDVFDAVPNCYETFILDNMEVLVMENLKKIGFELYDRKKPLNHAHQKKVMIEYGKFHALSFALRDQRPNEFNALTIRPNIGKAFFEDETTRDSIQKAVDDGIAILEERKDFPLADKFRKLLYKHAGEIVYDFSNEEISETTITHGDCWNNNFMYKYENDDRTAPSKVKILDWQISALRSPVFDLSHFIYVTSSKEQLDKFEELIETYYTSFSTFLRNLGSDPEKLFSYSTLKAHWRKYSLYGLLYLPVMLKFILLDRENVPDLSDLREDENMASFAEVVITEKDLYYERLRSALTHFLEFQFW